MSTGCSSINLNDEPQTKLFDNEQFELGSILESHENIFVIDGRLKVVDAQILKPPHVEPNGQHVNLQNKCKIFIFARVKMSLKSLCLA